MKKLFTLFSMLLVIAGIIVAYRFFCLLSHEYTIEDTGHVLVDKSGEVGDFIGGVIGTLFSLAGFIILIITLADQSKSNTIERFESNFFELVKFHRENVEELKYTVYEKNDLDNIDQEIDPVIYESRKVFRAVFEQFLQCRNEIKQYINVNQETSIFTSTHLSFIQSIDEVKKNRINLKLIASIDIAYCIMFYGLSAEGVLILERLFSKKYKKEFTSQIINYLKLKPVLIEKVIWKKWRALSKRKSIDNKNQIIKYIYNFRANKNPNYTIDEVMGETENMFLDFGDYHINFKKYYGGHQFRLGHYFRHLYQTVKFVDRHKGLSEKQKYSYVKILRAQLSTYEQALLFLNSVSCLGLIWEFNPDFIESKIPFVNFNRKNKRKLITKYALIKNLPGETIFGIKVRLFYTDIKYELE